MLASLTATTDSVGLGSGDRFRAVRGGSALFRRRGATSGETSRIAGKAHDQCVPRYVAPARRSLHGKEGVDGSSPSEGFEKASKWPFLLPRRGTTGSRSTRNCPQDLSPKVRARASSWLEQSDRRAQSTSCIGR